MEKSLLIYDGNCPMCRRAQAWVAAHARPGLLEYVACQSEERARRAPQVSEAQCMEAMCLVLPSGAVHAGADAFDHLLPLLRAPWRYLHTCYALPGGRWLAPKVYTIIARNRLAISGLFRKKTEGESCSLDKGCR